MMMIKYREFPKAMKKAAINGEPIPADMKTLPDIMAYIALRCLYTEFKNGTITREQGIEDEGRLNKAWCLFKAERVKDHDKQEQETTEQNQKH